MSLCFIYHSSIQKAFFSIIGGIYNLELLVSKKENEKLHFPCHLNDIISSVFPMNWRQLERPSVFASISICGGFCL